MWPSGHRASATAPCSFSRHHSSGSLRSNTKLSYRSMRRDVSHEKFGHLHTSRCHLL